MATSQDEMAGFNLDQDETADFIELMQKHTALSRIAYGELEAAILFATSNGYVIAKAGPAAE